MHDPVLIAQYVLAGLVTGVIYALMAVGITFIYSIMKMINWSMGEFFMIGSYLQFFLITGLLGPARWYLAVPVAMAAAGLLGVAIQRLLLRPMFVGVLERRDEYATIVTIALSVFFRNLAVVAFGPYQFSPPDYFRPVHLGPLPLNGSRFVAFVGSILLLSLFYLGVKRTWFGRALQGAAQNRLGVQTAGIDLQRLDQVAFGVGVALAASAGALLAPVLLVHPENGSVATVKGFEIIVIGGLGSIPGSIVAGLLLGLVESLGTVLLSAAYRDVYGFALLIAILILRPWGLFGERERVA
jgi:branched-chain amino acid transport system permease protein